MITDLEIANRLRSRLREIPGCAGIDYRHPPSRVSGGFETDIFRFELSSASASLSGPMILRRLKPRQSPRQAQYEAAVQNAIASQGFPAPQVALVETDTTVLGGAFLVMREMRGRPLAQGIDSAIGGSATSKVIRLLAEAPRTLTQMATTWTQAHLRLHELRVEPLREACAAAGLTASSFDSRLAAVESDLQDPALARLRPVLAWLRAHLPARQAPAVICHGDFHPLNILVAEGQVSGVLDWGSATLAEPAYDVGSTIANLRTVPIGAPMMVRPAVKGLIRYALRRYVRGYQQGHPLDLVAVRYYQVFRCTAHLAGASRAAGAHHSPAARKLLAGMIRRLTGLPIAG